MQTPTDDAVQQAVESFVDRHGSGEPLDPEQFAGSYPPPLQRAIAARCRQFLQFDQLVGHQRQAGDPAAGTRTFGDFTILEELGRGGMGIVYLAVQRSLNRRVALKVMQSGLVLSRRHVERFRREAEAAARLRHPGIVAVHSLVEVDGTFGIAMDYVAGRNLADVLADLRLQRATGGGGSLGVAPGSGHAAECAVLAAQIAAALAAAHASGVAHRDLKPRNLMLDEHGQVRLLDFGLAKSLEAESLSQSGELTGTVHYMSPEQTLGKRVPVDHRTDVFSLGVILYELLTLQRPFDGKSLQQVVYEICFKEPKPIARLDARVPRDLITICQKALEKDPQKRYASAAAMEADLQRFLRYEPIQARPAGPLLRLGKWMQRHRAGSLMALCGAGAVAVVLGVGWWQEAQAGARAGRLMQRAEAHGDGDVRAAIGLMTEALALRPQDPTIRAKLETLQQKRITAETRASAIRAEAARLITRSNQELTRDREAALLLALEAVRLRDSAEAKSAVLSALGVGFRAVTLTGTGDGDRPDLWQARLSPDGTLAAVAREGGRLELIAADGSGSRALPPFAQGIAQIAFAPAAGARLLAAAGDRAVRLFDVASGERVGEIDCGGAVERIAFDGEGRRLLVVAFVDFRRGPWTATVWDLAGLAAGSPPLRLGSCAAHTHWVQAAALSPDGRLVVSCGDRGLARLWRADDGQELRQLPIRRGRAKDAAFRADSAQLAIAADDGSVQLFLAPSGDAVGTLQHSGAVNSLAFAPDGAGLLTASEDTTARLWRLPAGKAPVEAVLFGGHDARVNHARFDRSGSRVVTACGDGRVRVFDAATGAELCRYEVGTPLNDAEFDAAGEKVLLYSRSTARLWDSQNQHGTVALRHPLYVNAVAAAGADRVVTAGDDKLVRVFRARSGERLAQSPELDSVVTALAVDAAGERMVVGTWSGRLTVLDAGAQPLFELPAPGQRVLNAAFAGRRILAVTAGGARVFDADAGSTLLELPPSPFACGALSADGALLATADRGAAVARLWSVPDGRPLGQVGSGTAAIRCLAFRPGSQALLACSDDQLARLWAPDGRLLQTLASDMPLHAAAFSADGAAVLLCGGGSVEQRAQLWDVDAGAERLWFRGHRGLLTSCAFSGDGQWAITGSRDRSACIWPTDPVAVARQLPLRQLSAAERSSLDLPDTR